MNWIILPIYIKVIKPEAVNFWYNLIVTNWFKGDEFLMQLDAFCGVPTFQLEAFKG